MSKQTVLADIKAKIKPNGEQQITGQILQDVLVESVELAATGDDLKAIQTEISKKANQDYVDNIKNAVDTLHSDTVAIQTEVSKKANASDVPTKTSELTNDSDFTTQAYVVAGLETKADKTSLASIQGDITNLQTKTGNQDKSITANSQAIQNLTTSKQDKLESGVNIKTVNNQSLLGSGNITIEGGGSSVTVDDTLSDTSTNPVQNKVITTKVNSLETSLNSKANTSDLESYATKTDVDTEFSSVNSDIASIQTKNVDQDKAIKANSDNITGLDTRVTKNTSDIATLNQAMANKANTSDIPTKTSELTNDSSFVTSTDVSTTYATKESVTALTTEVGKKASQSDLDNLSSSVTSQATDITNLQENLSTTSNKVDEVEATVTTQGQTLTSIQAEIGDINTQLTEING